MTPRPRAVRRPGGYLVTALLMASAGLAACGTTPDPAGAQASTRVPIPAADTQGMTGRLVGNGELLELAKGAKTSLVEASHQSYVGPVALEGPDDTMLYNSFKLAPGVTLDSLPTASGASIGTPSIRLLNLKTGTDTVLAKGSLSIARSATDVIAYVSLADGDIRTFEPRMGDVHVQAGLEGRPVSWSQSAAQFNVLAWAGEHLLAYRTPLGQESNGELVVFDGPGKLRSLGQQTDLVGVSPDGATVLVSRAGASDNADSTLDLLDVASAESVGTIDLAINGSASMGFPSAMGSWDGDRLVVDFGNHVGVFTYASGTQPRLVLDRVIEVPTSLAPFLTDAHFTSSGTRVNALSINHLPVEPFPGRPEDTSAPLQYTLVDCEIASGLCTSHPLGKSAERKILSFVKNPSRPAALDLTQEEK